jgi:hypothetical protein
MASFERHQLRWLTAFLWPGMMIFMIGLVLACAESLARRLAALLPLIVMTERGTMRWWASAGALLAPLVAAAVTGPLAYLLLGGALSSLFEGMGLSAAHGLQMGATALVSAVICWWVITRFAAEPQTAGGASFEGRAS